MNRAKLIAGFGMLGLAWTGSAFAGLESVPADESKAIQAVANIIASGVRAQYAKDGQATRDAHAKAHGCVRAKFIVNANLPAAFRTTVFQEGREYPAWIRYSNGSGSSKSDSEGDGRGMAVKLMDVPGDKLADEKSTQDFLMINNSTFFVRNAADYVDFSTAVGAGKLLSFFFPGYNPMNWRLHEMSTGRSIQKKVVANPLTARYFSMTPYLIGQRAMKYSAWPCVKPEYRKPNYQSANYLREAMSATLATRGACFEFGIQLQSDAKSMPVEDPTIEWSEKKSRFVKVATILIPAQRFETAEQQAFCENLSMNPWHAVAEHRPLGGINRVRKTVYETVSRLRHELNRKPLAEPTGKETFPGN